jgi:hypothetical protein
MEKNRKKVEEVGMASPRRGSPPLLAACEIVTKKRKQMKSVTE